MVVTPERAPRIRLRKTLPWIVVLFAPMLVAAVFAFTFVAILWAVGPTL